MINDILISNLVCNWNASELLIRILVTQNVPQVGTKFARREIITTYRFTITHDPYQLIETRSDSRWYHLQCLPENIPKTTLNKRG